MERFSTSVWVPLDMFGEIQQGATLSRVRDEQGTEARIIHIRDLDELEVNTKLETDRYTKDKLERFLVEKGDVLISLRANPVKASVVTESVEGSLIGSNLARVRPYDNVDPYFLAGLLRSDFIGFRLSAQIGGSMIPSLSTAVLRRFELPLIVLEQQKLLAESFRALEQYGALASQLVEARSRQLEAHLGNLFEAPHA